VCHLSFCRQKGSKRLSAASYLIFAYSALETKESWKPFVQFGASHHELRGVLLLCWARVIRKQDLAPQSVLFPSSPPLFDLLPRASSGVSDDGWSPWISEKQATNLGAKIVL